MRLLCDGSRHIARICFPRDQRNRYALVELNQCVFVLEAACQLLHGLCFRV